MGAMGAESVGGQKHLSICARTPVCKPREPLSPTWAKVHKTSEQKIVDTNMYDSLAKYGL